jgi:hypothetical protein
VIQSWIVKSTGLGIGPTLWETVGMAEKRTKADKEQRHADRVDDKAERRPEQVIGKKKDAKTLAEPLNPP